MAQNYQPSLTTFKVSTKKPEKVPGYDSNPRTLSTEETISKLRTECSSVLNFRDGRSRVYDKESYGNLEKKEIIQGSRLSTNTHLATRGLISLVIEAWENHHKLTLRPDDIWTALMVQFSFYVNANAETLRSSFVSHEEKKTLTIEVDSLSQVKTDMASIVEQFTQLIDKNLVDGEVKDWVIPNFSTTTKEDKLVCGSVLMATMKSYFNYAMFAGCGIPSISLDGTVEDWQNIKNRINKFRRYNLNEWADMLEAILEQFVQAKKGKLDIAFWGKICHWEGGVYKIPELSGWITAFCVFDKHGEWQGKVKRGQDWPIVHYNGADGYVTVDIVLMDLINKYKYNTTLYAGHLGREIVDNGFGLKPKVGWMLALVGQTEMTVADLDAINPQKSDVTYLKRKNKVNESAEIGESRKMQPTKRRRRTELELLLNNTLEVSVEM